jgi:hypothetical protein
MLKLFKTLLDQASSRSSAKVIEREGENEPRANGAKNGLPRDLPRDLSAWPKSKKKIRKFRK